jgi:hypothetical protein
LEEEQPVLDRMLQNTTLHAPAEQCMSFHIKNIMATAHVLASREGSLAAREWEQSWSEMGTCGQARLLIWDIVF